jgi:hypothetical protein
MNDGESPETWRTRQAQLKAKHVNGNGAGVPLAIAAQEFAQWPTPTATEARQGYQRRPPELRGSQESLTTVAVHWSTPKATPSGPDYARANRDGTGADDLITQVAKWATPMNCGLHNRKGASPQSGDGLATQVNEWSSAPDGATPFPSEGQTALSASSPAKLRKRGLNPRFALWLMGFPVWWLESPGRGK